MLGAAAPVPRRAKEAEAALTGQKIDEKTTRAAAEAALKEATPLANNGYKVPLLRVVIARAILAAARGEGAA